MKNVIEKNYDYTILGKNTTLSINDLETRLNNNVIIEGTSGCGKTRGFVIPNILNANSSYVVVDAKGIIYSSTKDYMKKKGYKIRVLNLRDLKQSDNFNPLQFINNNEDIKRLCKLIVPTSLCENDPFWAIRACEYLNVVCELMFIFTDKEKRNIYELCDQFYDLYINSYERKRNVLNFIKYLKKYSKIYEYDKPVFSKLEHIIRVGQGNERTYSSVIEVAKGALDYFYRSIIKEKMSSNDFDFKELGDEKTIYYVIVSDVDRSNDILASLFFDIAFQEVVNYADSLPNQRLKVPVRFIMDDFATNIDVSSNFPSLISSIRSRNISTVIVVQNIKQLVYKFKENSETVISNNSAYIYMGSNSLESMKRVSQISNISLEDIQTLPYNKEIILINGQKAIIDEKYDLCDHDFYEGLKKDSYLDYGIDINKQYEMGVIL